MRGTARSSLVVGLTTLALACGTTTSGPHEAGVRGEGPSSAPTGSSASVVLLVDLTQTSQNPTPTGLPTSFAVSLGEIQPGGSAAGSWTAENGDPAREPREGEARIEMGADGSEITIRLFRPGGSASDDDVLTLTGTLEDGVASGTFSDALYYPRVGFFEAARR